MEKATVVGKSLMAQYETLAIERDSKFAKKCSVTYGKILLIPSGILVACMAAI